MTRRRASVSNPIPLPSLADLELAASPAPWRFTIETHGQNAWVELFDAKNDLIFVFSDEADQVDQLKANLTWIVAARNAAARACR